MIHFFLIHFFPAKVELFLQLKESRLDLDVLLRINDVLVRIHRLTISHSMFEMFRTF